MPPMLDWNPNSSPTPTTWPRPRRCWPRAATRTASTCNLIEVSSDVAGNAAAVIIKSELAQIGINVTIQDYELITAYAKKDEKNGNHASQMGARYWTNDIIDPR